MTVHRPAMTVQWRFIGPEWRYNDRSSVGNDGTRAVHDRAMVEQRDE